MVIRFRSSNLLAACLLTLVGPAVAESLCSRLADEARRLPAASLAREAPLQSFLRMDRMHRGTLPPGIEAALTGNAALREQLGAGVGELVGVERLAGADVYRLDVFQGTAHCQSSVFVSARPGEAPQAIKPPFESSPCWTQSGTFGQVFGQPAYVIRGAGDMLSQDLQYQVAAWAGQDWGPACRLKLAFEKTFQIKAAFCAEAAACSSGRSQAMAIAKAYDEFRANRAAFKASDFSAGAVPEAGFAAAVQGFATASPPAFPMFAAGKPARDVFTSGYSNVELRYLPLQLDGVWLVGLVGQAGVGWRESQVTLVSLFTLSGGQLKPLAGFQVEAGRGRLLRALAEP